MSWSISAIGKAQAVASGMAKQFAVPQCQEPEETVRQAAAHVIAVSLASQDPNIAVKVSASGSMGFKDYSAKTGPYNNVSIVIEPLHGFVE